MNISGVPLFVFDRVGQAVLALKDNRRRTLLSILGITVGIAAVMAVGTVSKGGNYLVFSELETFGLNSVWVYRDRDDKDPHKLIRKGSGIENDDYQAIAAGCCSLVRSVSAVVHGAKKWIIQTTNHYSNANVQGVDYSFTAINNDHITSGRKFRQRDITSRRAVAILGPTAGRDLFGPGATPIGEEFRIGTRKFTVIGVLQEKSRDFLASIGSAGGADANNRILIPYTLLQQMLGNKQVSYLHAEAVSLDQAEQAAHQLIAALDRRNGRTYSYKSETMATYIATSHNILNGVALIGIVAASISLIVGGLGIMNIMSTSVHERTREIGLRKAIGARRRDILLQFLLEASIISTAGGLIGLTLGAVVSSALAKFTGFPLTPSVATILIALLVSVGVGVISGFLPAKRAAALRPVEALRYE